MAPTAAAAAPVAQRVVARSALSGQLLGSAESVEEVQQQITRQLGVSSYCQVLFTDDDPCEMRVALQSQVNDFDAELLSAAEEGAEQVEELLRHFQSPNCVDEMERTPLLIASKAGHLDAVRCLLEAQAEVNRSSAQGYTPVGVAAYRGDLEMLDCLVAAAADVEKASLRGFTALHGAAHGNSAAVIGRLLEVRADLERTTVRGKTALCIACEKGFSEVVRCLLDAGAEVEGCYGPSSTKKTAPLLAAAEQGHVEVVDLLLERQAEVNRSSSRGFTALHAAAENGQVPVMHRLLAARAQLDCEGEGFTPLLSAVGNGHQEAVEVLLNAGAPVSQAEADSAFTVACGAGEAALVRRLLASRANPEATEALCGAASGGHMEVVALLLELSVDLESAPDGLTPLCLASEAGHLEVVCRLLQARAQLDAGPMAAEQGLAARAAALAQGAGHMEVMQLLETSKGYWPHFQTELTL